MAGKMMAESFRTSSTMCTKLSIKSFDVKGESEAMNMACFFSMQAVVVAYPLIKLPATELYFTLRGVILKR